RSWLRPVLAATRGLAPPARFVADRLTPGGLGLEFTTVLAIVAVALYVVIAYTVIVSGDPSPTPGDQTALDVARNLQTTWLTDLAKVITQFGSAVVTLPITVLATIFLAIKRRWAEAGVLVAATAIIYLGVQELKDAIDRPRPVGALTEATGFSFPSGHA